MPNVNNVLVVFDMEEDVKKRLENINPKACYTYSKAQDLTQEMIDNAEVILGSIPPEKACSAKNLKWLQLSTAGSDHYQKHGNFPENAVLTNASGSYGLAISEYMFAGVLMLFKKMNKYFENQQKELWQGEGAVRTLNDSTVLVIGMGDIGGDFAKKAKMFGAYVVGVRRTNSAKPDYADEVYLTDELDKLLGRADVVALALPGTGQTQKILSAERIAMLKNDAVVINVGRGTAIDTDALACALENGKIAGACLDVTDPEPLPAGHKLWKTPNTIITPHVSGGNNLAETYVKIMELTLSNYAAFVSDKPLKNVVDFVRGY